MREGATWPVVITDPIGRWAASHPLSATTTTNTADSFVMGRTPTKSVARVYADVNAKLGPSWHEYGAVVALWLTPIPAPYLPLKDNLQVQWGSQDHYEIVRKVGRGKYSEVGTTSVDFLAPF